MELCFGKSRSRNGRTSCSRSRAARRICRAAGGRAGSGPTSDQARGAPGFTNLPSTKFEENWTSEMPIQVRAMVLAKQTLFASGPPDLASESDTYWRSDDPRVRQKLAEKEKALRGDIGAKLWVISAVDGKRLAQYELDAPPVWDGMSAAKDRLYFSMKDGSVRCMAPR